MSEIEDDIHNQDSSSRSLKQVIDDLEFKVDSISKSKPAQIVVVGRKDGYIVVELHLILDHHLY